MSETIKQAYSPQTLSFTYTNYKGETSIRTVTPFLIYFGSTKWHPETTWLLQAFDCDKGEKRDFALKDCDFTKTGDT